MKRVLLAIGSALASRRMLGFSLLALLVALRVWNPSVLQEIRLRTFDLYQNLNPRTTEFRPVVIVDIDEESLGKHGQWPWPRTIIAKLVTQLTDMKAVAIAFDIVFAEPDRSSPAEAVKYFGILDPETRARLESLPNHDDVFAEAISHAKVVLGQSGTNAADKRGDEELPETGFASVGPDPSPYLDGFPHLLRNLSVLEQAAAGRGLFSIIPDPDGVVRRVPIVMKADGRIVPGLTLDVLRVVTKSSAIQLRSDHGGVRSVAVRQLQLPTDGQGRIWINFGPHDKSRFVSSADVLEGRVGPERFAGKLVLVGASAIGLSDIKTTPVHSAMPGVEVHAQLLEAALSGALLDAPNYAVVVEMLGAVVGATVLSLLAPLASVFTLFATAFFLAAAFAAASWTAYTRYQMLFDATFPIIAVSSVYASLVVVGYFREQLDRRRIRTAFAQYLSPTLVDQLAKSRKQLVLGGEDRIMTVLFSDVRGFTTISETFKDDPRGLTALMNRFLTPVSNAIAERKGTIDKYMGDAVMAFWNAPLENPTHDSDACNAALDMLERVDALNDEREQEAAAAGTRFVPIHMGIGINTGRCTVGNMGSDMRFQYTVMGDTVNLASRLEGQTKAYGLSIIIGSRTASAVADEFALLEIDSIRVKGKTEPETIYTILGRADVKESAAFKALAQAWEGLRVCYRKQDWAGARKMLDACRSSAQGMDVAGLLDAYAARIDGLEQTPPAPDWDGVYTAETK
jgi:adenylate cyclase